MTRMYNSKHAGEVPYLDHTNYHLWSSGIQIHLEAIGAFDMVSKTKQTTPPVTISEAANDTAEATPTEQESVTAPEDGAKLSEERRNDVKARGIILGSCSESVKLYLAGCKSAHDMWHTLKKRMDASTTSKGRSALRRQFRDLRPVSGRPIIEYISRLNALRYQLAGTEQKIDDESFCEQLLSTLPSGYDNLVEILNEQEGSLKVEDLIRKIQQSEMAKSKRGLIVSSNTAGVSGEALIAGRGRGTSRGRGTFRAVPYRFAGNCHQCGEPGHRAAQCHGKTTSGGGHGTTGAPAMSCFGCGERGHGTKTCPYQTLTQAQAAKGRESFSRWRSNRPGNSTSALITSAIVDTEPTLEEAALPTPF